MLPTLAIITGTSGWYHAKQLGFLEVGWPAYGWVVAALVLVVILTIQGLLMLFPVNIRVYLELRKAQPDGEKIGRLMKFYIRMMAVQGVTQIATGDAHVLARRGDGTVAMWGMDLFGQSTPPAGLAGISRVAAGAYHSLALRSDGVITGWGLNANGQCTAPADLGAVSDLSGGLYHTLALRSDGKVRAWGLNSTRQCEVPITLSRVVQVAAGDYHSAALTDLGEVVVWGTSPAGDLRMPSRIAGVSSIASGTYHLGAIFEGDCNANGVLDATDVAQGTVHDHNVNGQPDECDLARGYEEDCDHDGVIDSYEQGLYAYAYASSGPVGPIGDGHPVQWTYENPSLTLDDPVLAVHIRGDFSSPSEWLQVMMNGRYIARLLASGADKNYCRDTMTRYVSIPRDFFNQYIQAGDDVTSALFEATTSLAVNANQCPSGSFVWFEVAYTAATTGDCNANGLLDTCEIGAHPETDLNSDGVLDACQGARLVTLCPGDIDMDGSISLADLSLMLLNFGPCMPGDPADLDGSLNVDNSDINLMLLDFGPCS